MAEDKATGWMVFTCDVCGVREDEVIVCSGISSWLDVRIQTLDTLKTRLVLEGHACSLACLEALTHAQVSRVRVEVFGEAPASGVTRAAGS
jgi:hypothetical protein